jgi:hypothetical protein
MPGEMALNMILWEYVVHGWVLARATGQPWSPPAGAVGQSLEFAPAMLTPGYQGDGKPFAPGSRCQPPPPRVTGCSGSPGAIPPRPSAGQDGR